MSTAIQRATAEIQSGKFETILTNTEDNFVARIFRNNWETSGRAGTMVDTVVKAEAAFIGASVADNAALGNAIQSNPISFYLALNQAAQIGVQFSRKEAYLLPLKGSITLQVDYKSLITIAKEIAGVTIKAPKVIYEGDDASLVDGVFTYRVDLDPPKNRRIIGVYVEWIMADGNIDGHYLNAEFVYKRYKSKSPGKLWDKEPELGFEKSAIRYAFSRIPKISQIPLGEMNGDTGAMQIEPQPVVDVEVEEQGGF